MAKRHFVLVELNDKCNYPVLVRIKDYFQVCKDNEKRDTNSLAKDLEKQGYKKIELIDNVIYYKNKGE